MRYILSFIGYILISAVIHIIAIETQSQFFAILFWILLAIPVLNIFRAISWAFHFHFMDKKEWKIIILRYFLNSFIPKNFIHSIAENVKRNKETMSVTIFMLAVVSITYFIKQETGWIFFSVVFWISFIFLIIEILFPYYESGEEELENAMYDEPIGIFKILGFCLSFWFFFIGVANFETIHEDTMPLYADALVDFSKERIAEMFRPSGGHHGDYDDEEPYFRGHLGRE